MKKNAFEVKHRSKNGYFPQNINHLVVQISSNPWPPIKHHIVNVQQPQPDRDLPSTVAESPDLPGYSERIFHKIDVFSFAKLNIRLNRSLWVSRGKRFDLIRFGERSRCDLSSGLRTQGDLNNQMVDILWKIPVFGPMF